MIKIVWSPFALERMEEVAGFIASDNANAANKWIDDLFDKVELLKNNPEIGRVVPELNIKHIRELIFGNYRVIYRYDTKTIGILTIRNFKQLLPVDDIEE